ncbi:hypothetical protein JWG42_11660 [Desulfoprunum benzoelyticum]|uniref:ribonucleoside-diphosphate reductase n=1 Tax=Desulfoprunum benzoelyticum TaxID=1506996 RepID=A0A840UT20_9BACT|nr:hypothetical protein [Desulfoprunum benzoelyticum]MBB5348942.1 hypothetical protein [Desulfoprunum benzoelyticum]MBM9530806.1 hypothetical protein [Desulfoprunum benzoelyticum]
MTRKKTHDRCAGCGQTKDLLPLATRMLCQGCCDLITGVIDNPGALERLLKLAETKSDARQADGNQPAAETKARELPDVLDAVRYRTTDRDRNTWYVSVSELDGHPVEIFASTAFDRDQHLQSRISNLTTITRLISLILRHIFLGEPLTLDKTLTQLNRSSRQKNDLPEMLAQVLSNYTRKQNLNAEKDVDSP